MDKHKIKKANITSYWDLVDFNADFVEIYHLLMYKESDGSSKVIWIDTKPFKVKPKGAKLASNANPYYLRAHIAISHAIQNWMSAK